VRRPQEVSATGPADRRRDPPAEGRTLHGFSPAHVYPEGVELFRQGALLQEVFYIASGVVKLVRSDREGNEAILGLALPGAWLGSAAAIAQWPSPVASVTSTRVLLQRIPTNVFCELLERDPDVSRRIHQAHARELCRQAFWLAQLSSVPARLRLERVLRQLITALGLRGSAGGVRLQLPLRHWELAQLVAVSPEHLSRLLKDMDAQGVVRREKGWVVVPDLSRLSPAAEDGEMALWCDGSAEALDFSQDHR
jgi:CRP/FNR family transcriptional regulator